MSVDRWFDHPVRILLSVGLIYGMHLVTRRAIAEWYLRQPSVDAIRKAVEWDPKNPSYHADLARVLHRSFEGDLNETIQLYEHALLLGPVPALWVPESPRGPTL